jgi:hypothetical protein
MGVRSDLELADLGSKKTLKSVRATLEVRLGSKRAEVSRGHTITSLDPFKYAAPTLRLSILGLRTPGLRQGAPAGSSASWQTCSM